MRCIIGTKQEIQRAFVLFLPCSVIMLGLGLDLMLDSVVCV